MKAICKTALFIALSGLFGAARAQNKPIENFKAMTFNVLLSGQNASYDVTPYANFINREKPDFVALEEVDHYTLRNGYRDFVNTLGAKTGMFALFVKAMDYGNGFYGNVLLSKYPILGVTTTVMRYNTSVEPRAGIIADVLLPSGQIVQLCAVHLEVTSEEARLPLIQDIMVRMQKRREYPSLIAGDFNSREYSPLIVTTMSSWKNLSGEEFTVSLPTPTICIDYIFGYPKNNWVATSSKVYPNETVKGNGGAITNTKLLSDHAPVMVTVSYNP